MFSLQKFRQSLPFSTPEKAAIYVTTMVALLGGLLTFINIRSQQRYAHGMLHERAMTTAELAVIPCRENVANHDRPALRSTLGGVLMQEAVHEAQIFGSDGELLASGRLRSEGPSPISFERRFPDKTTISELDDKLIVLAPINTRDGPIGLLRIVYSTDEVERNVIGIIRSNLIIGGVLLVCALILSFLLMRRVLRPLNGLLRATRLVAQGHFDTRVEPRGSDELAVLSQSFNAMAEALQSSTVSRDELVESNRALERARQEAVDSNRAKSEFLANMSHEIRTPLTAILGYADLLMERLHSQENRDSARTIFTNGRHLLTILDDILDLSKIEAGKMSIEKISCSPIRIAHDISELMRIRADAKGLNLSVEWRAPIPKTIDSDPTRIRQILVNLLGNALKFTESGSVTLRVGLASEGSATDLCFEVIDTGIGMSQQQVDRLFQPFTQGDETTTRRFGGTGLGLAITQRCAELLGGRVEVDSEPGKGSRFSVSIPCSSLSGVPLLGDPGSAIETTAEMTPQSARAESDHALAGMRILLAEDGPDNQKLFSLLLRRLGAEVQIAADGREAHELALGSMHSDQPFDLVLMDMQMPVVDGYTATAQLREDGFDRPIIALTAHAMSGDREKCLAAGCDEYSTKPLRRKELVTTILELTGPR